VADRLFRLRAPSHFGISRVAADRRFVRPHVEFSAHDLRDFSVSCLAYRASRHLRRRVRATHAANFPRMKILVHRPVFLSCQSSNQALERTADRRENLLSVTSPLELEAKLALVSGRSACSR
jgi:hypothetical protein